MIEEEQFASNDSGVGMAFGSTLGFAGYSRNDGDCRRVSGGVQR